MIGPWVEEVVEVGVEEVRRSSWACGWLRIAWPPLARSIAACHLTGRWYCHYQIESLRMFHRSDHKLCRKNHRLPPLYESLEQAPRGFSNVVDRGNVTCPPRRTSLWHWAVLPSNKVL